MLKSKNSSNLFEYLVKLKFKKINENKRNKAWFSLVIIPISLILLINSLVQSPAFTQSFEGTWRSEEQGRTDTLSFKNGIFQRQQEFCSERREEFPLPSPCTELTNIGKYQISGNTISVTVEGGSPSSNSYPYSCIYTVVGNS